MKQQTSQTPYLHDGYSEATKSAYGADWKVFSRWCTSRGLVALPSTAGVVVDFLRDQGRTKKAATLSRRKASISSIHRDHKHPDPTKDRDVSVTLKHLYRKQGRRQKQARALNFEVVDGIAKSCGKTKIGVRDKALILVAYDLGCRRSELVALLVEDLITMEDGSGTILIRKAKSDQEGSGQIRYLSPPTMKAVDQWIENAGIEEGVLFRSIKNRRVTKSPMPARDVSRR